MNNRTGPSSPADVIGGLVLLVMWFGGIGQAAGWWKLLALVLPPYGMYLFVCRALEVMGF